MYIFVDANYLTNISYKFYKTGVKYGKGQYLVLSTTSSIESINIIFYNVIIEYLRYLYS